MFDFKNYKDKKNKGVSTLVIAGDGFAVATTQYDLEAGTRQPDQIVGVPMDFILNRKAELEAELADIDSFIKDCDDLKKG